MAVVRNVAIVLALAALVAFLPGGGNAAALIGAILGTLVLAALVIFAIRWYRDHRFDLDVLGDRHRALLYGAVALVVFAMAGRTRLLNSGIGSVVWVACIALAGWAAYLAWRHWREYV